MKFKKPKVFLSHSGRDAHRAIELAATLKRELTRLGDDVVVFNTSEPEHRYKNLQELLTAGDDWRARAQQYEEELRAYLRENLHGSSAFLSLVTPNSLGAASNVIDFEIETARSEAMKTKRPFFFPCVADGARLRDFSPGAIDFQGIELDAKEGLARRVEAVRRELPGNVGP